LGLPRIFFFGFLSLVPCDNNAPSFASRQSEAIKGARGVLWFVGGRLSPAGFTVLWVAALRFTSRRATAGLQGVGTWSLIAVASSRGGARRFPNRRATSVLQASRCAPWFSSGGGQPCCTAGLGYECVDLSAVARYRPTPHWCWRLVGGPRHDPGLGGWGRLTWARPISGAPQSCGYQGVQVRSVLWAGAAGLFRPCRRGGSARCVGLWGGVIPRGVQFGPEPR